MAPRRRWRRRRLRPRTHHQRFPPHAVARRPIGHPRRNGRHEAGAMLTLSTPPTPSIDPAAPSAEDRAWVAAAFGPGALGAQYQLVRELGRGGMGIVFLARDLQLHRVVAIKLLRRELSANDDDRARFRREARLMARLTHPSIVPVHAYGEHDLPGGERVAYFVMRHV